MINKEILLNIELLELQVETGAGFYERYLRALTGAFRKEKRYSTKYNYIWAELSFYPIERTKIPRPHKRILALYRVIKNVGVEDIELAKRIINGQIRLTHPMVEAISKARGCVPQKSYTQLLEEISSPMSSVDRHAMARFDPQNTVKEGKQKGEDISALVLLAFFETFNRSLHNKEKEVEGMRMAAWTIRRDLLRSIKETESRISIIKEKIK